MKRWLRGGVSVAVAIGLLSDGMVLFVWNGQHLNPQRIRDARVSAVLPSRHRQVRTGGQHHDQN